MKKSIFLILVMLTSFASLLFSTEGAAANKSLAPFPYAITHIDMSQSDAIAYPIASGKFNIDLNKVPFVWSGPVNIITLASTSPDYMWAANSGGAQYVDISKGGYKEVARIDAPGEKVLKKADLQKMFAANFKDVESAKKALDEYGISFPRMTNGIYSFVDSKNQLYYNTGVTKSVIIFALKDPKKTASGIKIVNSMSFKDKLAQDELIAGVSITYDGKLIILGNKSLFIINADLKGDVISTIKFPANENITNSLCVDEKNGIYVASDKTMYKVVWTGTKLSQEASDGAWSSPYDSGDTTPTVKVGTGTGSTPTLMGFGKDKDHLVVITDGANKMKLVAFWRDDIPKDAKAVAGAKSNRIAGQIAVTCGLNPLPDFIQSEQSVVVDGYGAFVVNNIAKKGEKDKILDVMTLGPINEPGTGVERFEWDPIKKEFHSVWARADIVSISMVPTVSTVSNIVLVNGYTKDEGWFVKGMDWATGKTLTEVMFGQNNLGNGAYAILQLFPNGDLLFNSIAGTTRIKLK